MQHHERSIKQVSFDKNIRLKTIELMLWPCPIVKSLRKGDKRYIQYRGLNHA